ncbi:MAG: ketol-acid reductoisomerase, partial [Deltaproteobacteria bacterium]|nr:ketol-acid reductoisomerase [Deltaproteobacteria bacterium]
NAGALAHTYAKALVREARQVFDTTVREETETDLFSEQVLSCGGLMCLIRAAFQAMVDAGYSRMMAHYICLQEVKDLATLFAREGLSGGMARTSRTAQYGALTRGPRVIGEGARAAMRDALDEIRGGRFAAELAKEAADGFAQTERLMKELAAHPLSGACK